MPGQLTKALSKPGDRFLFRILWAKVLRSVVESTSLGRPKDIDMSAVEFAPKFFFCGITYGPLCRCD